MLRRGEVDLPRRLRSAAGAAAALLVLTLAGCQNPNPGLSPAPERRGDIERRALDLLLRAAQHEDPVVCSNAIEALVKVAPEEGLPHFRAALRSDSPLVRFAGLVALGTAKDRSAHSAIRQAASDGHPLVRLAAAFAACRLGDQEPGRVLVTALNADPDENVRAEAAHLIGLLGEPRASRHLQVALRRKLNQRSPRVLVHIYTALATLRDAEAVRELIGYAQGTAATRLIALQGLAEAQAPDALEALRYRMGPGEDYLVHRLVAARGAAALGDRSGYPLAMENLNYVSRNSQDPEEAMRVRCNAALALGSIGDARALPALRALAQSDKDPLVQVSAACAICQITRRPRG